MNHEMSYGEDYRELPLTSLRSGEVTQEAEGVWCQAVHIVNVAYIQATDSADWVLVDAGMPGSADAIIRATEEVFGTDARPSSILLTHGHFDHVGAVIELVEHWQVPVYAHAQELPFLTGKQGYAPADTAAGGGLVPAMAVLFPNEPIDLKHAVQVLPTDGSVPGLKDWRWIHTPGHTAGHISLFRERDGVLIAGDAFVTVKQESIYHVITQELEFSGPPRYFTADWAAARRSVEALAELQPAIAICGHGRASSGQELTAGLSELSAHFDKIALPPYIKNTH
ncbi:MBL fold metallo-hydrolase [Paenibacillus daejeonensis]|uniref:MBL fold metallo-hydrolase n=1 Tax=Paenibacillus daejeonensis TaxID=135193 RepID=UPI000372C60C|nr:MBL fold metallo-hydrolase [Paenibacillus daejeonensis]